VRIPSNVKFLNETELDDGSYLSWIYPSQYFGQFLSREAMPTASFTNATQHKNQKSEWNLSPKQTEKKALF